MIFDMRSLNVLLSLCLVASSGAVRADQQDDLLRAASWCATAARVTRGWQDRSLPLPYTRRTLKIAVDQLQDLNRAFAERNDEARGRIVRVIEVVRGTRDAVERQDTGALPARLAELDREYRSLASR